jgi:hypothetical protein
MSGNELLIKTKSIPYIVLYGYMNVIMIIKNNSMTLTPVQ